MNTSRRHAVINLLAAIRYAIARFFKSASGITRLNQRNWKWISRGALVSILVFFSGFLVHLAGKMPFIWLLFIMILVGALPFLFGILSKLGLDLLNTIDRKSRFLLFSAAGMVLIYFFGPTKAKIVQAALLVLGMVFIAGALSNLGKAHRTSLSMTKIILNVFFLTAGVAGLFLAVLILVVPGPKTDPVKIAALESKILPDTLALPDPSEPGPMQVRYLTYGSGNDRRRSAFAEDVSMVSASVDGSPFIDGWDGFRGKLRTMFWGFGVDSLPLNGRMWMPEGNGPFPLVLIVHGNHLDRDYSDPGYAYLGEHLASHGIITVSVDENFINGTFTNFGQGLNSENDARGWLLLKHIEQLSDWNRTDTIPVFSKIDTSRIVMVGHSRGGEAVCVAAFFNRLSRYPDNALEKFSFNFGIRGVVAIAQVDGQYKPGNVPTPLNNLNYLALQGSYDADMNSYHGLRQFNRVTFDDSLDHFKAGILIHRANHGQFNTVWGDNDIGYPGGLFINKRDMLNPSDQRRIAKVYITSFVKSTLGIETGYRELFRDFRAGRHWLPEVLMLNQYRDNADCYLVDYQEDLDLTTAGDRFDVTFSDLSKIREEEVYLRWSTTENRAVILGWNNSEDSIPGVYALNVRPQGAVISLGRARNLVMTVGAIDDDPGSREKDEEADKDEVENAPADNSSAEDPEKDPEEESGDEPGDEEPLDFTIALSDSKGDTAALNVATYWPIQPLFTPQVYKHDLFARNATPENIPQYISLPVAGFREANPGINLDSITGISFIFDRTEKGIIMIDDIGYSQ